MKILSLISLPCIRFIDLELDFSAILNNPELLILIIFTNFVYLCSDYFISSHPNKNGEKLLGVFISFNFLHVATNCQIASLYKLFIFIYDLFDEYGVIVLICSRHKKRWIFVMMNLWYSRKLCKVKRRLKMFKDERWLAKRILKM